MIGLEKLQEVSQVLREGTDFNTKVNAVLDVILDIYQCDRAWLFFPCTPESQRMHLLAEKTRPEYPGTSAVGEDVRVTSEAAETIKRVMQSDDPVQFGGLAGDKLDDVAEKFSVRSQLLTAIQPQKGEAWLLGIHQCSTSRQWDRQEVLLFKEIGNRIVESLDTFALLEDLKRREQEAQMNFENSPVSCWLEDFSGVRAIFEEFSASGITDIGQYFSDNPQALAQCAGAIKIENINQATLDLHNAKSKAELYEGLSKTFTPESFIVFKQEMMDIWNGVVANSYDGVVKTLDGELRYVLMSFKVVPGYEKSLSKVLISLVDNTDKYHAEQEQEKLRTQLMQARKMESIGNLAGGIAHDFNNILASVIGFTELALEDAPRESELEENLQEVYQAGLRAKELVKQILAFSRQSDEVTRPVQMSQVVADALKLLRPILPTTIEIEKTITSTAFVRGNATELHQILLNICTNGAYAMQDNGGILHIDLKDTRVDGTGDYRDILLKPGEYVELIISDTGMGIDPAIAEDIFEPYFTTKPVGEGSGMGLAMVKGIVERYGGDIRLKSTPGEGAAFSVLLPVTAGDKESVVVANRSCPTGQGHILLVDDEPMITKMGCRILEGLGYMVTEENSSPVALELVRQRPELFDLVISDMTMPQLTGDRLALGIKKIRPDLPIILCTGFSNRIRSETAGKIGVDGVVYKPFTKAELASVLQKVLSVPSNP